MADTQDIAKVAEADLLAAGRVLDAMGWPEIEAYHEELRRGQGRDDAGGYMLRAIARLFGIERGYNPQVTYEQAARAALSHLQNQDESQ